MTLRSGSLNRLLRFERRTEAANEFNEDVGNWVEFAQVKAQVRALGSREFFAALQAQSENTLQISCRYVQAVADAKPSDRVVDGTRIYDVQAVQDPDGRRRELRIYVVEHSTPAT